MQNTLDKMFERNVGRRFRPSEVLPARMALYFEEHVRKRVNLVIESGTKHFRPNKTLPWIHFDFVHDTNLDAHAFLDEDQYFISFNAGTPLLIQDFFFRMLAYKDILPDVGNSGVEVIEPEPIPELFIDTADRHFTFLPSGFQYSHVTPIDPVRMNYAYLLTDMALVFLAMHEFAHIHRGHLLFVVEADKQAKLSQTRWSRTRTVAPMRDQAMEMMADRFATFQGIGNYLALVGNPIGVQSDWQIFFQSHMEVLQTWDIAIYALWRLFGAGKYQIEKMPLLDHPTPRMRQAMITSAMVDYLNTSKHLPTDAVAIVAPFASLTVETAVAKITGSALDFTGVLEVISPEGRAHMNSLTTEYRCLEPELHRLSKLL